MKQESGEGWQRQATELSLGGFMSEVFLEKGQPDNAPETFGMVERRDSRSWNAGRLEQRKEKRRISKKS